MCGANPGRLPEACQRYWQHCPGAVWAADHPAYHAPYLLPYTIPVRFHGDDVAYKTLGKGKLLVMSLHGAMCPYDSLTSRLISVVMWDHMIIPQDTLKPILEVWAWSWRCAFHGVWPDCDHNGHAFTDRPESLRILNRGKPLAGAFRFAFAGALGDWVFHAKIGYPWFNGHSCNFMCHRDLASSVIPSLRYEDASMTAGWRRTVAPRASPPRTSC